MNPEQFALAMWLINRKQSGKDPPAALTPDMVPPSMRPKGQDAVGIENAMPLEKDGSFITHSHFYFLMAICIYRAVLFAGNWTK